MLHESWNYDAATCDFFSQFSPSVSRMSFPHEHLTTADKLFKVGNKITEQNKRLHKLFPEACLCLEEMNVEPVTTNIIKNLKLKI